MNRFFNKLCVYIVLSIFVFSFLPITALADDNNFTYTSEGSESTITGYIGTGDILQIPAVLGGLNVTKIGENAFASKNISSVSIPDTVNNIGSNSFNGCNQLTKIYFMGNQPTFGNEAFSGAATEFKVYYHISKQESWADHTSYPKQAFCSLTIHLQEGTSPLAAYKDVNNGSIEQPHVPVREGYTFGGWYLEAEYVTQWANENIQSDVTLYAKWTTDQSNTAIDFPDVKLKQVLIGKGVDTNNDGTITQGEMASLSGLLSLDDRQISNLSGLEYAENITQLNLDNNFITDISNLSSLTKLTVLKLQYNYLDISPDSTDTAVINSIKNAGCTIPYLVQNKLKAVYVNNNFAVSAKISEEAYYGQKIVLPDVTVINTNYFTFLGWDNNNDNTVDYQAGQEYTLINTNFTDTTFKALYQVSDEANTIVDIKDYHLRDALKSVGVDLNKDGKLTKAEMCVPEMLYLNAKGIMYLDGLEYATRVKKLLLDDNANFSTINSNYYYYYLDLSPLAKMPQLNYLGLNINNIYNITPLQNLTNLTFLRLSENVVHDISPLSSLVNLQTLYLRDNNITDIEPLLSLTSLKEVYLDDNLLDTNADTPVMDNINTLKGRNVAVDYDQQKYDIYYPVKFRDRIFEQALLDLGVDKNNNHTIEHVEMASLTGAIDLSNKGIIDLTGMELAYGISSLNVSGNNLDDFDGCFPLFNLDYLDISNNRIDPNEVDYKYNKFLEMHVRFFESGGTTVVYMPQKSNVVEFDDMNLKSALIQSGVKTDGYGRILTGGFYQAYSLLLQSSNIYDLTGIEYARRSDTIILYDNHITDVSPLDDLCAVKHLDLSQNNISDISPLIKMTNLVTLNLSGNPLDLSSGSAADNVISTLRAAGVSVILDIAPNQAITFSDANLKAGLLAKGIDKNNDGEITPAEMASVTGTLDLSLKRIANLNGLQYASGISVLNLQKNAISDITQLRYLTQLDTIYLEINKLNYDYTNKNDTYKVLTMLRFTAGVNCYFSTTDLTYVHFNDVNLKNALIACCVDYTGEGEISESEIDSFDKLILSNKGIVDLTGLKSADHLKYLDLSHNNISDISSLFPSNPNLDVLLLSYNNISNISILSMDHAYVDISMNGLDVSDGTAVKSRINSLLANGWTGVTYRPQVVGQPTEVINFPDANLKAALIEKGVDVDGSGEITQGEMAVSWGEFRFINKGITDVTGLTYAFNTWYMYLSQNEIRDVSPLSGIKERPTQIYLEDNLIEDITPLVTNTQLDYLYLSYNYIDFSAGSPQAAAKAQMESNGTYVGITPQFIRLTGVTLAQDSIQIVLGQTQKLNIMFTPGTDVVNQTVAWESDNTAAVTVDASGNVKGIGKGTAHISVTTKDGGFNDTCAVTVIQPVTRIVLSDISVELKLNNIKTLTAAVYPTDASNPEVTWPSSNEAVASVDQNGTVTAKGYGNAVIRATADGKSAACSVAVVNRVESVTLNTHSTSAYVGDNLNLTATVLPADTTYPQATWLSSNEAAAIVSQSGVVTAVREGTAIITATADGITDTCQVTVSEKYFEVLFDMVGGNAILKQTVKRNTYIQKPENPTKTGHTFLGWFKEAACMHPWDFNNDVMTENITLHANWIRNFYNITFISMGGSLVSSAYAQYDTLLAMPRNPARYGYIFSGWYNEPEGINAWNFGSDKVTGNITLYAKWLSSTKYTISATPNRSYYGTVSGSGSYNGGMTVTLTAKPKSAYRFVRWMEGSTPVSYAYQYAFLVTKNRTLKAEFAAISKPSISTVSSAGYNIIKIQWKAVTGAAGYSIYRSTRSSSGYKWVTNTGGTSYTDTGLNTGTKYYYKIKAYCTFGAVTYSGYSSYKSATPILGKPAGLKTAAGTKSITVSWNATDGATGYELYGSTSKTSGFKLLKSLSSLEYLHTSLVTGKTYYYKVRAYRLVNGKKVYGDYAGVVYGKALK